MLNMIMAQGLTMGMPFGLPPVGPFGLGFGQQQAAPGPTLAEGILGMERHQTMLREFDRLREDGRGDQRADMLEAMLEQERHGSLMRSLEGINASLREQTELLRGRGDNNDARVGGGISSTMALEVFKTLDNDRDGNVTRDELARHLGVAQV